MRCRFRTHYAHSILPGLGNGGFRAENHLSRSGSAFALALSDLNGDARADVVVTQYKDYESSVLAVLLNQGQGAFSSPAEMIVPGWLSMWLSATSTPTLPRI